MDSRPLLKLHTMSQDLTSKHYAITSEAATLHYLWSKGIPVPKVYGYSSSENNPIGAEYIIMEKASGIGLETRWLGMSKPEQHKLTSSFVETEKKFFDISFGSIRSLYFKTDIPPALQALLYTTNTEDEYDSEKLCIGPTADYMFWHGSRAALHLYHGPWTDSKEYLTLIANKEIKWTRQYGKPVELDFPHNGVFLGKKSPEDYLSLLNKYLVLTPYLLPEDAKNL